jgi:hypothetical protein
LAMKSVIGKQSLIFWMAFSRLLQSARMFIGYPLSTFHTVLPLQEEDCRFSWTRIGDAPDSKPFQTPVSFGFFCFFKNIYVYKR